jgi:hypothetical protein
MTRLLPCQSSLTASFESPDEKAGYYENKYHESDDKYRTAMELLTETREELGASYHRTGGGLG